MTERSVTDGLCVAKNIEMKIDVVLVSHKEINDTVMRKVCKCFYYALSRYLRAGSEVLSDIFC